MVATARKRRVKPVAMTRQLPVVAVIQRHPGAHVAGQRRHRRLEHIIGRGRPVGGKASVRGQRTWGAYVGDRRHVPASLHGPGDFLRGGDMDAPATAQPAIARALGTGSNRRCSAARQHPTANECWPVGRHAARRRRALAHGPGGRAGPFSVLTGWWQMPSVRRPCWHLLLHCPNLEAYWQFGSGSP